MSDISEELFRQQLELINSIEPGVRDGRHNYLSTACYHEHHDYCQREKGLMGDKTPAKCKFCDSKCWCSCHAQTGSKEHQHERHEPAREHEQMEIL